MCLLDFSNISVSTWRKSLSLFPPTFILWICNLCCVSLCHVYSFKLSYNVTVFYFVCCIFLHVFLLLHHCYLCHMLPTTLGCPWVPPPNPPPFFFLLYFVLSICINKINILLIVLNCFKHLGHFFCWLNGSRWRYCIDVHSNLDGLVWEVWRSREWIN